MSKVGPTAYHHSFRHGVTRQGRVNLRNAIQICLTDVSTGSQVSVYGYVIISSVSIHCLLLRFREAFGVVIPVIGAIVLSFKVVLESLRPCEVSDQATFI